MKQADVKVMIVDEKEARDEYRRLMDRHRMLCLAAETGDEKEALEMLREIPVDALILDLEIQNGSGILLLEKLQMLKIEKPFVEVVTNVISKQMYDPLRKMGADYICSKSAIHNMLDIPLSILEICAPYRKKYVSGTVMLKEEKEAYMAGIYRHRIQCRLKELGFSFRLRGTVYLEEGILYIAVSGRTDVSATKELYPYIAEKFDTNAGNVERNIRVAIEKVWTLNELEQIRRFYDEDWGVRSGRPTNIKFMRYMARKVTETFDQCR